MTTKHERIKVWDLPLRFFHWSLVVAMSLSYTSGMLGGSYLYWHVHSGVVVLALVMFRVQWGFVGSKYSRFSSFFPTIRDLRLYRSGLWKGVGHNPLAGLWIVLMLALITATCFCGLFSFNDEIDINAPLYSLADTQWCKQMTWLHGNLQAIIPFFVVIHFFAIGYHSIYRRQILIGPMVTGYMYSPSTSASKGAGNISLWRLTVVVITCGAVSWIIESDALISWIK